MPKCLQFSWLSHNLKSKKMGWIPIRINYSTGEGAREYYRENWSAWNLPDNPFAFDRLNNDRVSPRLSVSVTQLTSWPHPPAVHHSLVCESEGVAVTHGDVIQPCREGCRDVMKEQRSSIKIVEKRSTHIEISTSACSTQPIDPCSLYDTHLNSDCKKTDRDSTADVYVVVEH